MYLQGGRAIKRRQEPPRCDCTRIVDFARPRQSEARGSDSIKHHAHARSHHSARVVRVRACVRACRLRLMTDSKPAGRQQSSIFAKEVWFAIAFHGYNIYIMNDETEEVVMKGLDDRCRWLLFATSSFLQRPLEASQRAIIEYRSLAAAPGQARAGASGQTGRVDVRA